MKVNRCVRYMKDGHSTLDCRGNEGAENIIHSAEYRPDKADFKGLE